MGIAAVLTLDAVYQWPYYIAVTKPAQTAWQNGGQSRQPGKNEITRQASG